MSPIYPWRVGCRKFRSHHIVQIHFFSPWDMAMAKKYGGRWEIIDGPRLGDGGQGTVFRVRDITGQLDGEFALKRVLDISRRDRFRRQVEAIKRLTDPETHQAHPNVISLIDHSALDEDQDTEKQFLVMPIAEGGDLSAPGRLSLYKHRCPCCPNHPSGRQTEEHPVYRQRS